MAGGKDDFGNPVGHLYRMAYAHAEEHGGDTEHVSHLCEMAAAEIGMLTYSRDRALRNQRHAEEWHASRMERLKALGQERGCWPEMAAIIANGTATADDPLNFCRQLNVYRHRAEQAERRAEDAEERAGRLEAENAVLRRLTRRQEA